MSTRKPAVSIEKMIDEVFDEGIDDELIDELAESQALIRKFINSTMSDEILWQQLSEKGNYQERRKLMELIAITFLESDNNLLNIDLITSKHEEQK